MTYTRVNWKDLPDTSTPITAENLNKMDMQIDQNTNAIEQNTSDIATINSNLGKTIKVSNSSSQVLTSDTDTTIAFNTVDFNTSNNLNLSNNRINIGANINSVLVNARWTSFGITNTGDNNYIYIFKNGERVSFKSSRGAYTQETSVVIPVQENDYIEMHAYQSSSSNVTVTETNTSTFLQVTILG